MDKIQPNTKPTKADNSNITILAVDDNDALRYSLSRSLRGDGYKVIEARNGAEALQLADECPDLITLDVHLPDSSGFDICRTLKGNPKTSHIPILHISATFVDTEYRVHGLEAADGYLTEPISREELLATVGALLRLKHAEREARSYAIEAEKARRELKQAHDELEERVNRRTKELDERNAEIRQLTGQLLRLQDDERRRLARELHDSTGQMLTAMKLHLDRISRENGSQDCASLITETISINDELSRQLRTLSYLLHPPLLEEAGLPYAIGWYCDGFSERSGVKVELEISPEFGRLPGDMEIAIFRVIQECLTNIHRHSGSITAAIRLDRTPERVFLEVSDSGTGIAPHRLAGGKVIAGVGMMGIQERMRQFDGVVTVSSSANGTTVTADLPISADAS